MRKKHRIPPTPPLYSLILGPECASMCGKLFKVKNFGIATEPQIKVLFETINQSTWSVKEDFSKLTPIDVPIGMVGMVVGPGTDPTVLRFLTADGKIYQISHNFLEPHELEK
jgi:hypothetical protein